MPLSLVAGLGNPGPEYENTRHNAGFIVLDALAKKHALSWRFHPSFDAEVTRWDRRPGHSVLLVKPQTYMNESGRAVRAVANYYRVSADDVITVYDDLNIDLGLAKLSVTGSAGGHNGVSSLLQHLIEGFVRYRIGIGPKMPKEMDLKDFVLGNFTPEQQSLLTSTIDHHINGLLLLLDSGVEKAMNQINRRESK